MNQSVTRFGVIGTGRITRRLVADLQSTENVMVSAIASRQGERARWCADQYGIAHAVEGYQNLLSREDVDAVYLSLPPSLHAEWSIAAAAAGKHVLCEKPLAMNHDEAQSIARACQASGVRWLDATGWLHHPRTQAVSDQINGQRLGRIRHVSASVSFFEPFQSGEHRLQKELGGGCVLDLAWYACGLAVFVMKETPRSVYAQAVMKEGVPYRVTGMLQFDDDTSATISCGYDTATRKWFEIAGSSASLICDDFTRTWADKPARMWVHDAAGKAEQLDFVGQQERQMIRRLIGSEDLTADQQQALRTQRTIDAVIESLEQNAMVETETCT